MEKRRAPQRTYAHPKAVTVERYAIRETLEDRKDVCSEGFSRPVPMVQYSQAIHGEVLFNLVDHFRLGRDHSH